MLHHTSLKITNLPSWTGQAAEPFQNIKIGYIHEYDHKEIQTACWYDPTKTKAAYQK